MAQQFTVFSALAENWSSVPSSHAGQSSRGSNTLFKTPQGTYLRMQTSTIRKIIIIFTNLKPTTPETSTISINTFKHFC